nr:hypothetical protein [Tanacetum cinerariifolium]
MVFRLGLKDCSRFDKLPMVFWVIKGIIERHSYIHMRCNLKDYKHHMFYSFSSVDMNEMMFCTAEGVEHVVFVIFKIVSRMNPIIYGDDVYFVTVQNNDVLYQAMPLDVVCQLTFPVKLATVGGRVIINRVVSSANSHGNWIAAVVSEENGLLSKVKQISLFQFNRVSRCYEYVDYTLSTVLHLDEWMALAGCFVEASRNIVQVAFLFNGGGLAHTRMFVYDLRSCTWRTSRVSDLPYWRGSVPRLSSTLTI